MIRVKQFLVVASLLLSIAAAQSSAAAVGLEYYGVEMTIRDDHSVNNKVVLDFDSIVNRLDYNLGFKIENLKYEHDFDFADCSVHDTGSGSTISCSFIGMTQEKNKLTLDFDTSDVIRKEGDDYRFTVNYGIPLSVESSFILIRLPQNNILAGGDGESFAPATGGTITDGKHIMVFWEYESLETGENLQFSILFTKPTEVGIELLAYIATISAAAAIIIFIFYIRRGRRAKVAVVKSVLNKDEKKIIDILSARGGKAGQKILVRETDFSKAKVSRIVKSLKDRGVVDTEPISGRENRVLLVLGEKKPHDTSE